MNWENLVTMGKEKLLDSMNLEERRSGSSKFFSTLGVFAAGAIVGGAVALLLAPQKGDDLRKEITDKFTKLTGIGAEDEKEDEKSASGGNSRLGGQRPGTASRPTSSV